MSSDKYLLFDLSDDNSKKLGEVISNPTCKKIVNFLAEGEFSESDIAKNLNLALNTIEYNLKKLINAGIIEKSKHFWSVKGKKIETYKVANKLIVISPKKNLSEKLKKIIPIVLISFIFSFFILMNNFPSPNFQREMSKTASDFGESITVPYVQDEVQAISSGINFRFVTWFLVCIWIAILIFIIWSWRSK